MKLYHVLIVQDHGFGEVEDYTALITEKAEEVEKLLANNRYDSYQDSMYASKSYHVNVWENGVKLEAEYRCVEFVEGDYAQEMPEEEDECPCCGSLFDMRYPHDCQEQHEEPLPMDYVPGKEVQEEGQTFYPCLECGAPIEEKNSFCSHNCYVDSLD